MYTLFDATCHDVLELLSFYLGTSMKRWWQVRVHGFRICFNCVKVRFTEAGSKTRSSCSQPSLHTHLKTKLSVLGLGRNAEKEGRLCRQAGRLQLNVWCHAAFTMNRREFGFLILHYGVCDLKTKAYCYWKTSTVWGFSKCSLFKVAKMSMELPFKISYVYGAPCFKLVQNSWWRSLP